MFLDLTDHKRNVPALTFFSQKSLDLGFQTVGCEMRGSMPEFSALKMEIQHPKKKKKKDKRNYP